MKVYLLPFTSAPSRAWSSQRETQLTSGASGRHAVSFQILWLMFSLQFFVCLQESVYIDDLQFLVIVQ